MAPNARTHLQNDAVLYVVTRGNNKMQVFHAEADFERYLQLLKFYQETYPVSIYHYCLMNNHIHLLIRVKTTAAFMRFMQGVSQSYSNHYKRTYQHTGHLWQGRYKSFHIEQDSYLLECGRYIERNPVRAGIVKHPKNWFWSSYRYYAFGIENDIVTPHPLYHDLGKNKAERQASYQDYLTHTRPYGKLLDRKFVNA